MNDSIQMNSRAWLFMVGFWIWASAPTKGGDDIHELALNGQDPVELIAGTEEAGLESVSETHEGFVYRFLNEENRQRFRSDPDRFGIQLRGRCGTMPHAQGRADLFLVHDERIYLFGTEGCREEFRADPKRFLDQFQDRLTVAVVLFEGVELLDFAGPGEVFAVAGGGAHFDVITVAESETITSQGFLQVKPTYGIQNSPQPDILVIPGGGVGSVLKSEAMMKWIQTVAKKSKHVLSVCNGALVLGKMGLLDGLSATTHFGSYQSLRQMSDKINVVEGARYIDNGKIITTAGVSAGIDGSLYLVGRIKGEKTALDAAKYMEYDWRKDEKGEAKKSSSQ